MPASNASESFRRSCAWNWSSGKQVAQRDAEERAGGERERGGGEGAAAIGFEPADAEGEQRDARRDHQREAEVDEMGQRSWRAGAEHQADDREGVGRLVDEGGEEDAPGRRPRTLSRVGSAGRRGAGQRDAAGQRMGRQIRTPPRPSAATFPSPPVRRPGLPRQPLPPSGPLTGVLMAMGRAGSRVGGGFVVVEREEALQKEQGEQPERRPASVAGEPSRTASGSMWKNAAPSIAPAEEAEVNLQPRVRQDRGQRQQRRR